MIYHTPMRIDQTPRSGERVRRARMLEAFRRLGLDVSVVEGPSWERRAAWRKALNGDRDLVGVYSELSTMPIALTDPDHLPRMPFLDMTMFRRCRRMGVPVCAFYRDIYWRFSQYNKVSPAKRIIGRAFHRLELYQLSRSVSRLFVPSMRMVPEIPIDMSEERIVDLPPGGEPRDATRHEPDGDLGLLYVGGIQPPLYDIAPILEVLARLPSVKLTVCCRPEEWEVMQGKYMLSDNVQVVHKNGAELEALFRSVDAFLMYREATEYLKFAMPVKLFEAIGAGLPLITNSDSEMGSFVSAKGIGWAVSSDSELEELLRSLSSNRADLEVKRDSVLRHRHEHTWEARAQTVLDAFEQLRDLEGGR